VSTIFHASFENWIEIKGKSLAAADRLYHFQETMQLSARDPNPYAVSHSQFFNIKPKMV
jgi:hypothetical protein